MRIEIDTNADSPQALTALAGMLTTLAGRPESVAPVAAESVAPAVVAEDEPSGDSEPGQVDHNGVYFNPDYCGNSAEPFYSSGKQAGQWKKKRGVEQADYDAWYASQTGAATEPPEPTEPPPVNSASAFTPAAAEPAAAMPAMATAGDLMKWISEHQTAGRLSQDQIAAGWAQAGAGYADVFPPNTPDHIAATVARVHAVLGAML